MCSWRKLVFFCSQMKLLQIRPGIWDGKSWHKQCQGHCRGIHVRTK
jgi:hypothetical protein